MDKSIDKYGFVRVAAVAPKLVLGNPKENSETIIKLANEAVSSGTSIINFPELSLTGYTLGDLFHQDLLLEDTLKALESIKNKSKDINAILCIGAPLSFEDKLFNTAVLIYKGEIMGIVPKTYLPGYKEFYEERWFSSARDSISNEIELFGAKIPFGTDLLFCLDKNLVLAAEICEDVWMPLPPSSFAAIAGANIILNLSASNELVGKADYRRGLIRQHSANTISGYVYTSSGVNESTTDVVYSGHAIISENGYLLEESERFNRDNEIIYADLDMEHLVFERKRSTSFSESVHDLPKKEFRRINVNFESRSNINLNRFIDSHPFIPHDSDLLNKTAEEIFLIQSTGLAKRLESTGISKPIIGLSGGLDSTLALLVIIRACKNLNIPLENIQAFTMPGFATSDRTKSNAKDLARAFGITLETIDITKGATQHLKDLGQDIDNQNVVFENTQARYRTMILMNKANQLGGLVVGTGDLSEIALGWNTFNGDQISHYNVNCGVPKTLVKYLIEYASSREEFREAREILADILSTPISPELTGHKDSDISQKTEDIIGPYELHDFFLYHLVRWGSRPSKILFLASIAFKDKYNQDVIRKWLKVFIERFSKSQWKRSVMPDGPKIGSVALSPRGDWRMPSDMEMKTWIDDILY